VLRINELGGSDRAAPAKHKGAWSWAAPLVFAALLAGCAGPQQTGSQNQVQTSRPAVEKAATEANAVILNAALPAPPSAEFDHPPVIQASLPGGSAAGRLKLTGLERASVIEALGAPRLSRREASAEVLTFSGLECSLFVFLYDGPDGIGIVRHIEARARQGFALVSESRCIDSVLGRKAAAPANPV
jgi:hypothetical protein